MSTKVNRAAVMARMALGVDPEDAGLDEEVAAQVVKETPQLEEQSEAEASSLTLKVNVEDESGHLTELKDLTKQNARLEVQVENLEASLETLKAGSAQASTVIKTCVERLGTALGTTVVGLEELSLNALCAQFTKLDAEFTTKFPVGGKSRPLEKQEMANSLPSVDMAHRTAAARKTTKRN